jgi:5-methyltetrahydropteroyltriglutamate--homocysteine methyltransferase
MFRATKDMPLATTVTGSLPRPGWYTTDLHGRSLSIGMGDRVFREQ